MRKNQVSRKSEGKNKKRDLKRCARQQQPSVGFENTNGFGQQRVFVLQSKMGKKREMDKWK
jgi:hypothetical protein